MFRWPTIIKGLVACNLLVFIVIFMQKSTSDNLIPSEEKSELGSLHGSSKMSTPGPQKNLTSKGRVANENVIVNYVSLATCNKPTVVPDLKASCWYECKAGNGCTDELTYQVSEQLVSQGRATRHCFPSQHLIGIRKCGTTDLAKWFQYQSPNHYVTVGDVVGSKHECPDSLFKTSNKYNPLSQRWFNYGPGNLMLSTIHSQNTTHMTVKSTIQLIGFMNEPNSRYILSLRNPTDRMISYIFHAHKMKWIYSKINTKNFNAQFIHGLVVELVKELKQCVQDSGELACIHMENSRDGNLKAALRHGLYVVYLHELFKFVPQQQVYINHLEEYSSNQSHYSEKIVGFFGEKITWTENAVMTAHKTRNCGTKSKIDDETIRLLDELYLPFNQRLALLLKDHKWMFVRTLFAKPSGTFCG